MHWVLSHILWIVLWENHLLLLSLLGYLWINRWRMLLLLWLVKGQTFVFILLILISWLIWLLQLLWNLSRYLKMRGQWLILKRICLRWTMLWDLTVSRVLWLHHIWVFKILKALILGGGSVVHIYWVECIWQRLVGALVFLVISVYLIFILLWGILLSISRTSLLPVLFFKWVISVKWSMT